MICKYKSKIKSSLEFPPAYVTLCRTLRAGKFFLFYTFLYSVHPPMTRSLEKLASIVRDIFTVFLCWIFFPLPFPLWSRFGTRVKHKTTFGFTRGWLKPIYKWNSAGKVDESTLTSGYRHALRLRDAKVHSSFSNVFSSK